MIKNRLKYTLVLLMVTGLSLFYYNYPFLIMLIVVIMTPFLSAIAGKKAFDNIDVTIDSNKKILGKFKEASIILKAVNGSFFPIVNMEVEVVINNSFYKDEEEYVFNMPVRAKGKDELVITTSSVYAGNINACICRIHMYDLLGLKKFSKELNKNISVMILPCVFHFEMEDVKKANGEGDINYDLVIGEDTSEIFDIRKYIAGDKIQRIHWKLSVKHEEMMVKEFAQIYDDDLRILLELNSDNKENLDMAIDAVFSISLDLIKNQDSFVLCWFNSCVNELCEEKVTTEEELYRVFAEIFASNSYDNNYQAKAKYIDKYGENKGNTIYVAPKWKEIKDDDAICIGEKVVILCI